MHVAEQHKKKVINDYGRLGIPTWWHETLHVNNGVEAFLSKTAAAKDFGALCVPKACAGLLDKAWETARLLAVSTKDWKDAKLNFEDSWSSTIGPIDLNQVALNAFSEKRYYELLDGEVRRELFVCTITHCLEGE